MILDNFESFAEMDPENMLAEIDSLPDQLRTAWDLGQQFDLPDMEQPKEIVLVGMGGSAIGADLLQAYVAPMARIPITVWRDYDLPQSADGPQALIVTSSHSGNTEEVLSAFDKAKEIDTGLIAITTGGELAVRARESNTTLWTFDHIGQPRAAVGYSFGLLLALISRMGVIADPTDELVQTAAVMKDKQKKIMAQVPVVQNTAKRVAGQLMGRWPTIMAAEHLAPVARRWSTQINELAKAVCYFQELPEADHNLIAGVNNPEELIGSTMILFLKSKHYHPRNVERTELTRKILMLEGFNTDAIPAKGDSRLAEQWSALHFGDYVAFYLAMSYSTDPTPVHALESLKKRLAEA
jgi:glucose/mannose-6-phosphate isomerase